MTAPPGLGAGGAYYAKRLSGERLRRCYEIASPAVRAYLEGEIALVSSKIIPGDRVLDLGCGYGRVLQALTGRADFLCGIDTSLESLRLARANPALGRACVTAAMNARALGFRDGVFDVTFCIQNGISAFGIDPVQLAREALRVTRAEGLVLFSSYAESFWPERLEWFEAQSACGLIGEIDLNATGGGTIVCKDGFRSAAFGAARFRELAACLHAAARVFEVDSSSLFCEMTAPDPALAAKRG